MTLAKYYFDVLGQECISLPTVFFFFFLFFCLDTKEPKDQDFIKFQCTSTSGFCHATQAVRHKIYFDNKALSSWLTSALLEMPHAHKTILELLLKFYNVDPYIPKTLL